MMWMLTTTTWAPRWLKLWTHTGAVGEDMAPGRADREAWSAADLTSVGIAQNITFLL